jgi:mannose-6-phosphate isomerase-like protein (cupin superfamily)
MKLLVKKSESTQIKELSVSQFHEYDLPFNHVAVGVSEIHGRYPEQGYEVDKEVEQVWYIEKGRGTIWLTNTEYSLEAGDMMLVPKGEKYWIEGNNLKLIVSSSPPWFSAQHAHIE